MKEREELEEALNRAEAAEAERDKSIGELKECEKDRGGYAERWQEAMRDIRRDSAYRYKLAEQVKDAEAATVTQIVFRQDAEKRVRRLEEMIRRMLLEHECKWYLPEEGDCFTNGEENPCVWCCARAAIEEEKRYERMV